MDQVRVIAEVDGQKVPIMFDRKPSPADVDAAVAQWRKVHAKPNRALLDTALQLTTGHSYDELTTKPKASNSMPLANVTRGKDQEDPQLYDPNELLAAHQHDPSREIGRNRNAPRPTWRENVDAVNKVIHDVHDTATDWAIKNLHGSDTGASQFFLGGGVDKALAGHGAGFLASTATMPLDILGDVGVAVSPDAPLRDRGGAILNVGLKTVLPGMLGKGGKAAIEALKAGEGVGAALKTGGKAILSRGNNFGLKAGKVHPDVAPAKTPTPAPEEVPGATFRKPKVHADVAPKVQPRDEVTRLREEFAKKDFAESSVGALVKGHPLMEKDFADIAQVPVQIVADDRMANVFPGSGAMHQFSKSSGSTIIIPRSALDDPAHLEQLLAHEGTHAKRAALGRGEGPPIKAGEPGYAEQPHEASATRYQQHVADEAFKGHKAEFDAQEEARMDEIMGRHQTFTGPRHSETDAIREKLGWPERTKEGTSVQAILEQSKGKVDDAVHIADTAAKEGRPLSDIEQGAVGIKLAELDNQLPKLRTEMDAAKGTPEYAVKEANVSEAEDQLRTLVEANDKVGTEWGKSGRIRQVEFANDFTESGIYRQMFKKKVDPAKLGDKFIPENAAKVAEKDAQIADLQQQLVEAKAGKVVKETAKKAKGLTREAIHAERQQIYAELDTILKEGLAKTHSIGSVAYDATRLGGTVGKLAVNYMKEGVVTLEEVVAKVIADLRGKGIEATREDVLNAVDQTSKPTAPRSELEKQLAKLKAEAKRLSETGQARAETKRLADLNKQIGELREQIKPGVKLPSPENKAVKKMSDAVKNAQAERDLLTGEIRGRIDAKAPKTFGEGVRKIINYPTSLRASIDISAGGRQGWLLGLANPDKVPAALADELKAMASPLRAAKVQNEILTRANAPLYKRAKLFISPMSGVSHGEEQFASHLFPQWNKFNPFKASERAYTGYLNRIRADVFDRMVKWIGPNATDEELQLIGNYINVATGRGGSSIGVDKMADGLSNIFFAPRFVASRFEYALGQPMLTTKTGFKGTGKVRLLVARQYAQALGALGGMYMMAKGAGADVSTDMGATDFAKIRIGDTRIDPLGGIQQGLVFGWREATGNYTTGGGKHEDLNKAGYGKTDKMDVLARFFRSKLNPMFGAAVSLATHKDYLGRPYSLEDVPRDITAPMSVDELARGLQDDGWSKEDAYGLLNFLGINANTQKN